MVRVFPCQLLKVRSWPGLVLLLMLAMAGVQSSAQARPVICTTSLEAAFDSADPGAADFESKAFDSVAEAPVEVTRCDPVESTEGMLENRAYTWTAPYASGVDLIHQFTDLLGIAMGGPQGNRLMGFGFPDQTIVWDGLAVQNTYLYLMEQQSQQIPLRTKDLANGFSSSIADHRSHELGRDPQVPFTPVRGLW